MVLLSVLLADTICELKLYVPNSGSYIAPLQALAFDSGNPNANHPSDQFGFKTNIGKLDSFAASSKVPKDPIVILRLSPLPVRKKSMGLILTPRRGSSNAWSERFSNGPR